MSKKQLVKLAILLIGGTLMAEYLPEPKPQRIVVGVTNGNSNNAEDGDTVGFWKSAFLSMAGDISQTTTMPCLGTAVVTGAFLSAGPERATLRIIHKTVRYFFKNG